MVLRRHRGLLQTVFVLLIIAAVMRYSYKYYKDNSIKLKAANIRHHELLEDRNRFSREFDVAMQSKSSLEYALKSRTQELSKYKKECESAKLVFENQANKAKSESRARFNSLDSEHRMLQASKDDLQAEHKHLRRNFDRMKEDHSKVESTYKKNYKELKEKEEKVISALQNQVEHYQKKENSLQIKVKELTKTISKYESRFKKLNQEKQEANDKLRALEKTKEENDNAESITNRHVERTVEEKPLHVQTIMKTRKRLKRGSKLRGESMKSARDVVEDKVDENKSFEQQKFLHELEKPKDGGQKTALKEKIPSNNDRDVMIMNRVGKDTVDVEEKKNNEDEREQENIARKEEDYKKQEVLKDNDEEQKEMEETAEENEEKKQALVEDEDDKEGDVKLNNANEQLNNDQKFDDQNDALQEGEENDDNAAEGQDKNDMLEPENLLRHKPQEQVDMKE